MIRCRRARNFACVLIAFLFIPLMLRQVEFVKMSRLAIPNSDAFQNIQNSSSSSSSSWSSSPSSSSTNGTVTTTKTMHAPGKQETFSSSSTTVTPPNPYFIFHVGIPKSATTTIQCGLTLLSAELASRDGTYYIGKPCNTRNRTLPTGETAIAGHQWTYELHAGTVGRVGTELQERLALHPSDDVVFSVERFSQGAAAGWALMKDMLQNRTVRIVVGYRRYFDFLPSLFFQQNYRTSPASSLLQFLQNHMDLDDHHPAQVTRGLYEQQNYSVHLFDMHQEGDLLTNFICQILPNAQGTCQYLQEDPTRAANDHSMSRPSSNLDRHRLGAAIQKYQWKTRGGKLGPRLEEYQTQFPDRYAALQNCLSPPSLERLFVQSLQFDRQVFGESSSSSETVLRAHFDRNVAKHKYCELDALRALDNEHFVEYILPGKWKTRPESGGWAAAVP